MFSMNVVEFMKIVHENKNHTGLSREDLMRQGPRAKLHPQLFLSGTVEYAPMWEKISLDKNSNIAENQDKSTNIILCPVWKKSF